MVSQPQPQDDTPAQVTPAGRWDLETVISGCKVWVNRHAEGTVEERQAEILSIRDKPQSIYVPAPIDPADKKEFYCHYVGYNKRLDDWIPGSWIILSKELEWPKPKPPPAPPIKKETQTAQKTKAGSRKATKKTKSTPSARGSATPIPSTTPQKRPASIADLDGIDILETQEMTETQDSAFGDLDAFGEDEDAEGENEPLEVDSLMDIDADGSAYIPDPQKAPPIQSKKQEIEKLRTSGSMTQNVHEIARVKNLNKLQIGKYLVEAWYFSPYPAEFAHLPVLYICELCLSYFPSPVMFGRHRTKCKMVHPPGNEIYRHEDISFFEIDGKKQLQWCRNLSLLSKCFLDHKTLYYDVQPFMFYVMCLRDSSGCHTVGYFSKEKESAEGYNLACILTLPQHQRHGYGRLLIEFSYELTKREGKTGSPEKPLSDLGLISYRAFWAEKIMEYLVATEPTDVSLDEIAHKTSIAQTDIHYTLLSMQMIKTQRNTHILCLTDAARETYEKTQRKVKRRIDPNALQWKPPYFTRDQLRSWAY